VTCMAAVRLQPGRCRSCFGSRDTLGASQPASLNTCAMAQDRYVIEKLEETVKTFRELQVLPGVPRALNAAAA